MRKLLENFHEKIKKNLQKLEKIPLFTLKFKTQIRGVLLALGGDNPEVGENFLFSLKNYLLLCIFSQKSWAGPLAVVEKSMKYQSMSPNY